MEKIDLGNGMTAYRETREEMLERVRKAADRAEKMFQFTPGMIAALNRLRRDDKEGR